MDEVKFMYDKWLPQAPNFTTFRVNKLKKIDTKVLLQCLENQSRYLNTNKIPNFYYLKPDCLIVEQWPAVLSFESAEQEVIVDALCAAAVLRGAHVFAPGIMGIGADCKIGDRVDIYGDLEGKCKRGLKVKYSGKKVFVGTGYLRMLRKDLFNNGIQPSGIAVEILLPASRLPVINETLCSKGELVLQNLPSIICGWVVNAQPYEYIIDMCAAPGNKTTHLAEMSRNKAFIIAIDKTPKKVEMIKENCERHGVTCVKAFCYDSTKCSSMETDGPVDIPPFPKTSFDKILLDAPCSGLGQRPQLGNKINPKMLASYKFVQRKLFHSAVNILKVGGELVYSTCTITIEENESIVLWALDTFPCLKLIPAEPLLGGPGLPDFGLSDEQRAMVQRFGPIEDHIREVDQIYRDTIGFFIAKFKKF